MHTGNLALGTIPSAQPQCSCSCPPTPTHTSAPLYVCTSQTLDQAEVPVGKGISPWLQTDAPPHTLTPQGHPVPAVVGPSSTHSDS